MTNQPTPTEPQGVEVFREFCYRWTCRCGQENRRDECTVGALNECHGCHALVWIATITYDNGAVVQSSMAKSIAAQIEDGGSPRTD